jgi:hypothetical protein
MKREDADNLGKLFGRYNPWSYGVKTIVGGVFLAALGGLMAGNHETVARKLTDTENSTPHLIVGYVLLGCGGLLAILGVLRMGQAFEIRRKGVRYRSWFSNREIAWRDIDEIFVKKVTYVTSGSAGRGRRSYYTVDISSLGDCIRLSGGFMKAVSALGIIQLLKLHHRREVLGDCEDIRVPESLREKYEGAAHDDDFDDRPRRPKKKRKSPTQEDEPSSSDTTYDKAAHRLAQGATASEVESWLRGQGIPAPAAAAMVDKAMATTVRRQAMRMEREASKPRDELHAKARAQLDEGIKPEKVERWLRQQGVTDNWAAAIMQNLREERL